MISYKYSAIHISVQVFSRFAFVIIWYQVALCVLALSGDWFVGSVLLRIAINFLRTLIRLWYVRFGHD